MHDKLTHDKGCETGIVEFVVKFRVNDKPAVNARQRVVKRTPDSDESLMPLRRMPFGLVQYQIEFFTASSANQVR